MRLIDADALIEFEEKAWDGSAGEVSPSSLYHIILDDIREAKTVEAIPVSFIDHHMYLLLEAALHEKSPVKRHDIELCYEVLRKIVFKWRTTQ